MTGWFLGLVVANAFVLLWVLADRFWAMGLLAGLEAGWLVAYAVLFRALEGELTAAKVKLATRRPDDRAEAQALEASRREIARQMAITRRDGAYFPESAPGLDAAAIFAQQHQDMEWLADVDARQAQDIQNGGRG